MINADLDIHLLRAFVEVAQTKSFTLAASNLYRTQSAVSMQIRRLEQSVGKPLFERNSRQVRLTEKGELFLSFARRILQLNDDAISEIGQPELQGRVRLGIPDDYASYFLPKVMKHFGKLYPGIKLEVLCELSVNLLPKIRNREIDLALVTRQPNSSEGEFIRREKLVWAEAKESRIHEKVPLPLALFPAGYCVFREAALQCLEKEGKAWTLACSSPGLTGIRAAVSAGLAVTIVAENTVSSDMRIIDPEEGLPALPCIEIALHAQKQETNEAVLTFAQHLREILCEKENSLAGNYS
jgi:DNA-binding transcriptional LysR family regulator